MKILNKKPFILGLGAVFCLSFLFIHADSAHALDPKIRQVRTSESPAVYFLYHAGHRKKAYLNSDIYLDYGNKWADVKVISSQELNSWPDVKLIKKADSPIVYFIQGGRKAVIKSWADLESFNLASEPILNVSEKELNYYESTSYDEIGLSSQSSSLISNTSTSTESIASTTKNTASSTKLVDVPPAPVLKSGKLLVYSELVKGANGNTLVTGSNRNLVGSFRFLSSEKNATISSITFSFTGLHDESALRDISVYDENDTKYDSSFNIRRSDRQAIVYFRNQLSLAPGSQKTMKIYLDLGNAGDNQTIKVEIKKVEDIDTSAFPVASFPLKGTEFKILNNTNLLGKIISQEEGVAIYQLASTGNRLIGKFTLNETSLREDVLVTKINFRNVGTANKNDWEDFRLFNNGQIISRVKSLDNGDDLEFNINYLKIAKGKSANLTLVAALKSTRNKENSVNIQLDELVSVGKTYNINLQPEIINIEEKFILN